jgi:hypothetical protein
LPDFYFDFYFKTENGKAPILNPYYPDLPKPRLDALGNGNYRIRFDYTGYTLPPHTDLPDAAGSVFMLHYADWSSWDRSNDCSYLTTRDSFLPDRGILVYDHSGKRLWGDTCDGGGSGGDTTKLPTDTTSGFQVAPPVIQLQPRDTTVFAGQICRFETRAYGDGTLHYQWRHNGVDIPGATDPVLVLSLITSALDGDGYSCLVWNDGGRVVSRAAILNVESVPGALFILQQPQDDTVSLGGTASFSVTVSNPIGATYQWFRGDVPLVGDTSSTLLLQSVRAMDSSGTYWVLVRSGSQAVDSRQARLVLGLGRTSSQKLTLSGKFSAGTGGAPADTTVDLMVSLYSLPTGGDAVWGEEVLGVPVHNGYWEIDLGTGDAGRQLAEITARYQGLYAQISFSGNLPATFGSRIPLSSVPYAYQAGLRMLSGAGAPTALAPLGAFYLNLTDHRLWRRESNGWRQLDP